MTSDDDRIRYLEGDHDDVGLDAADRAGLDDLRAFLADPAVWEHPAGDLDDRVVAAVHAEAAAAAERPVESTAATTSRRRPRWGRALVAGVAAAAVVAVVALVANQRDDAERLESALTSESSPSLTGSATFTRTDSGWRVELDAPDLPRLDGEHFYQAWLRDDDGVLVAIGTFNEGDDVVLWAGVSPRDFPTITITEEAADGDPASSGERVLAGPIVEE